MNICMNIVNKVNSEWRGTLNSYMNTVNSQLTARAMKEKGPLPGISMLCKHLKCLPMQPQITY